MTGRFPTSVRGVLLLLVLVVLLPLLLVQAGIYAAWYHSRWAEEERANLEVARGVAALFDDYVQEVHRQELAIGKALARLNSNLPEQANEFLAANAHDYSFVRAWHWVNPEGKIVASSDSRAVNLSIADRSYFREVRDGQAWAVSDVLTERVTGAPDFVVACRIADTKGQLSGVVTATVEPGEFGTHLVELHRAEQGPATIFDSKGVLVYASVEGQGVYQDWTGTDPLLATVLDSHAERSGVITLPVDGHPCIAACVPIEEIGWVAGARRPVKAAMAQVYAGLWIAAGLNLLVALGSGGLALAASGRLIGQLRRWKTTLKRSAGANWTTAPRPAACASLPRWPPPSTRWAMRSAMRNRNWKPPTRSWNWKSPSASGPPRRWNGWPPSPASTRIPSPRLTCRGGCSTSTRPPKRSFPISPSANLRIPGWPIGSR